MSFNINTATNDELKREANRLSEEYEILQTEVRDKFKKMVELSSAYIKITNLLAKRNGKPLNNDTNKG